MPERAALITALILDRPMCFDCIAAKSGLSAHSFKETLAVVGAVLQLRNATECCRVCGATTTVLSVDRPAL
jgi:hypothetical protein